MKLGLPRSCVLSAGLPYPRQRNLDTMCSAQNVSGSLRQQQSESRKDRLHVIALISEAVSVNVSSEDPSQLNTVISIDALRAAEYESMGFGDHLCNSRITQGKGGARTLFFLSSPAMWC